MNAWQQIPPQPIQVIDTRPASEFRQGFLPGAINLPFANIPTYGPGVIPNQMSLIWILSEASEVDILEATLADTPYQEFSQGFILWEQISDQAVSTLATIRVDDFMNLPSKTYQLLDVRHPDEITRPAPPENLISIPLQTLIEARNHLAQETIIYILCGSGNRATTAASFLSQLGYQTQVIEGGMKAVQAYLQEK